MELLGGNRWKIVSMVLAVTLSGSFLAYYAFSSIFGRQQGKTVVDKGPITVVGMHYPLELSMTVDHTALELGNGSLNITLIVRNIGNETLTLRFSDGTDEYDFSIYNEGNTRVYWRHEDVLYPQMYLLTELGPGETRTNTEEWDQRGDLILQLGKTPPCYYEYVPAGTYRIVGAFICRTLDFTLETPTIETPPIEFTISE
jgi:hypothetical protein